MTEAELAAIVEGVAPIVRELRDSLLAQIRTLEARNTELEVRAAALETRCHLLEFEASAVTGRP